jgi:hypothetical protein
LKEGTPVYNAAGLEVWNGNRGTHVREARMKSKLLGVFLLTGALAWALSISVRPAAGTPAGDHNAKGPVKLLGVIAIPGNPLISSDIAWVDAGTKRFYLADRSNLGIDIIDAENDIYVARVIGFAGPNNGAVPPPNGQGPNGVLVTPDKKVWAGDGNSTVQVADVDPNSPNYLKIIQSISTALPECGSHCDRADEIGYDPADHIILVANNQPLSATPTTPPTRGNPYATFINADTYKVLGHVSFAGATGLEQPLWVPELRRFLITVPGYRDNGGSNAGFAELAVIDPKTMKVEKSLNPGMCHASGEALGPASHALVTCGGPVVLNVSTGKIISTITQIGGGDEDWYNPGDGRFYFTANDKSTPPVNSLGVVDAQTGLWLQNVPDPGGRQAVALAENNHIFTPVQVNAAIVKDPTTDKTTCSQFGFKGTGCIAVFVHSAEGAK